MKDQPASPSPAEIETIFNAAMAFQGSERAAYLAGVCGNDARLRARVDALLAADAAAATEFLPEKPAASTIKLHIAPESSLAEKPGDRIGRYKLLQKIGEGGCGVVYMAEQQEPVQRRVALKVIKLGMDTKEVIARFEAERQALAMMDHPNIAKVLDAGATDTGRPFFVMELVRGIKITEYCDQNNVSTRERLDLFAQICRAIQHAHQKGIIHRDIKPSNILVTMNDGVPMPKVIDFGIAKATQGRLTDQTLFTAFEQFIGTPAYMSPEQAEMSAIDIDTRSDIYSLGVLLYELLTGKTPFETKELLQVGFDEMRRTIREREPVRPSTRLSTMLDADLTAVSKHRQTEPPKLLNLVRGDLDWIVMKCLEKDRTRRYETANGIAADILRHLQNEPVAARPAGKLYRFQKIVRRNKLAFAAAAAVTLALLVGLTLAALGWRQTRIERDKALRAQAGEEVQRKAAQASEQKAKARESEANYLLYVADMNLAQQAWDQNNIGRLRQLLEDTHDSPYRGFEWYFWQPKGHIALLTLRGHSGAVYSVAISPDGQRVASGSEDHTAKVWEAGSGKQLLTLKGHSDNVASVAFSPDGQRIVTGSDDKTAKVWDVASGRELLTLSGHSNRVLSVAFFPDGQRIVTASGDETAKVWDAASGKDLLTLKGHGDTVWSVAVCQDGQRIVTGSLDRTAKVWDAINGNELLTLKGHAGGVFGVAFSRDGQRIVTSSRDSTAKVWDAASGRELLTLKGHSNRVLSVAFSPDGRRIVSGSLDCTAKVWDAASGKELGTLKGHADAVNSVAVSPDGERIVTGSDDNTAKLWDASKALSSDETGGNRLTLKGHSDPVESVAFSLDGQRIITGSRDKTAKVWDAYSGKELLTLQGHTNMVFSAAFSPDGQRIVTGSRDKTAKVWEAASGRELLTLKGHSNSVFAVAFSPDSQRIVTGSSDLNGNSDKTAKVWDAVTGKELVTLKGHSDAIWSAAFSPDGQRIVTGSSDKTAKVWNAASGKELLALKGHTGDVFGVAFSPDGRRIVTGGSDSTAKVWDAASGIELLTLKGQSRWIMSVAYSPSGERIVTASSDKTAKLWDAASGKELLTLKGHTSDVFAAAFSPDGQRIVTGSMDNTAKVWEAASPAQVAAWEQEEKEAVQR